MIPEARFVLSAVVSILLAWFLVILFLGWIGRLGLRLGWWKPRRPLNLPRRP